MTQIFFFVNLKCHFCLDCQVKRIKQILLILNIWLFSWPSFHGAEKVSYSPVDCGTHDDDTNFTFSFFLLKMLLLSKILIQKNKQMLLILNIQLFCFYSVLKDHIKIQKENRMFQMWLMTLIFTHKYTQFRVKDRVTITGSFINHTVHIYMT